ncbi:putative signal transducing protein [Kaistella palustris]|uniref:DUF2007 domain-containing protein n=1 Tax=Kaistella palustris TaxID=493376 RepID=UPI00041F61CB|nr:DUF2007 domain-containing protein [Kaistella palustris]
MPSLVKFKFYSNSIEANRDKQILANHGLESFIANEQTIQSDWLLSQALGGIQLQVFDNEKEKAEEILKNFLDNERVELEVEHTIAEPEFKYVCPECGSNHLYRDENPGGLFGISLLFLGFPLKTPSHLYHCYYCGNEFNA